MQEPNTKRKSKGNTHRTNSLIRGHKQPTREPKRIGKSTALSSRRQEAGGILKVGRFSGGRSASGAEPVFCRAGSRPLP